MAMAKARYRIGVDLGGTKLAAGVVDPEGNILGEAVTYDHRGLSEEAVLDCMQPIVDAYTAKHPNVSFEYINIPANEYGQKLAIMLAGGDTSDIVSVKDIPMYASMVAKKQIEPLNSYIARDKVDLAQYSGVTDQITVDKVLYALPFRSDIWILYYNKDAFDKAKVPYPTNDMRRSAARSAVSLASSSPASLQAATQDSV